MKNDTYKRTIHDGSVSYSVTEIAPSAGNGKHYNPYKTRVSSPEYRFRKWLARRNHYVNKMKER